MELFFIIFTVVTAENGLQLVGVIGSELLTKQLKALPIFHSSVVQPIYHGDVKSSNILLDEKFEAKLSDFRILRLVEDRETSTQGTPGYLDPDYLSNFQLPDKINVYSFGVVLLELLTSQEVIDFNRREEDMRLVPYMKRVLKHGRLMDTIDPVIKEGASEQELETMKTLGFLARSCFNDQRRYRPSMKEVADKIQYMIGFLTNFE